MKLTAEELAEIAAADARYDRPPCMECGAHTPLEAEQLCNCSGDKDNCHGQHLWPDA
jgi:ribosomal protein L40E